MRQHRFRGRQIVASDPVLPVQLLARRGEPLGHQPERRLVTAILEDAIQVYLAERPRWRGARKAVAAAESWFASEETGSPFAFRNVCDVLGLDPSAVRSALARGRARVTVFGDRRLDGRIGGASRSRARAPGRGRSPTERPARHDRWQRSQDPIRAPP